MLDETSGSYQQISLFPDGLRRFGYSRDKRSDCVRVVIALIVTPEGLPVAYEVMPGNTPDKSTLPEFLRKIEAQYGKRNRLWIMDRGIPTEESLEQMRAEGASYLVGTPRGRLSRLENQLFAEPWKKVQDHIEVKLAREDEDLYVLTEVEQAFKELKNDLEIRPVYHQKDDRIESHIFVSFLSYCLQVTLKQQAKA